MIKAVVKGNGANPLIILGLSGENITRLAAGEPIYFSGADLEMPGRDFLILYGRTEKDIEHQIRQVWPG